MIKEKVKEITKRVHNLENGVIAADMERNGIRYHRNFGVSIVHLRQVATKYAPDQELAEALWNKDWRETKILATLIADAPSIEIDTLKQWISNCNTSELVEQMSLNLAVKIPNILVSISTLLSEENGNTVRVAATTLAHLAFRDKTIGADVLGGFLPKLHELSKNTDVASRRSLALAIRRIGRKNKSLNQQAVVVAEELTTSVNEHTKWIAEDVLVELTDEFILSSLDD